jgi:hypothetical protein
MLTQPFSKRMSNYRVLFFTAKKHISTRECNQLVASFKFSTEDDMEIDELK